MKVFKQCWNTESTTLNPVSRVLELLGCLVRIARAIRNKERSVDVEIHVDGTLHQGRHRHTLQGITVGERKGMRGELHRLHAVNRRGRQKEQDLQDETDRQGERWKKGLQEITSKSAS